MKAGSRSTGTRKPPIRPRRAVGAGASAPRRIEGPATALGRLIDDYLQDRRARGASTKTIRIYRDALEGVFLPFVGARGVGALEVLTDRVLNDLTAGLLDGTASRSRRPLSKDTVHSYVRAVNSFLSWARQEGEKVDARARAPKLGRRLLDVLSREEIQSMEDAASSERDKLIVRVLADTGLRITELLALTGADLRQDGRNSFLHVHGKGDRDRLVPVRPETFRRLRRFADSSGVDRATDRIFISSRRSSRSGLREPLTIWGAEQAIREVASAAGLSKRVYPHLLRHSFATHFLRRGGNPLLLQKVLGHESLAMITKTYSHLTIDDAQAEMLRVLTAD